MGGHMRIHNRYTAANGESHFHDIEIAWVEGTTGKGHLSTGLGQMRHSLFIPIE
jgi:hypothetical protein